MRRSSLKIVGKSIIVSIFVPLPPAVNPAALNTNGAAAIAAPADNTPTPITIAAFFPENKEMYFLKTLFVEHLS